MKTRSPLLMHDVRDMDRAWTFYHDILGMEEDLRTPGLSFLKCGGLRVGLHTFDDSMAEGPLPHAGLNLQVDDLDTAVEEIRASEGTVKVVRPVGGGHPVRIAEIADPDGNGIELRQELGS
jgi:predicted enzyme related to lactoylglutathione lyase